MSTDAKTSLSEILDWLHPMVGRVPVRKDKLLELGQRLQFDSSQFDAAADLLGFAHTIDDDGVEWWTKKDDDETDSLLKSERNFAAIAALNVNIDAALAELEGASGSSPTVPEHASLPSKTLGIGHVDTIIDVKPSESDSEPAEEVKPRPRLANNPTCVPSGTPAKPHIASPDNIKAWLENADALADFASARIIVRRDVYGLTPPTGKRETKHEILTREKIVDHFLGKINVGAFSVSPENECKTFIGDIDAHEDTDIADRNLERVNLIVETLAEFDLYPLVCDSDGKGGFHVREHFKKPIPSEVGHWLGKFINDRLESAGLQKVEFFPKQSELVNDRPYGNWVRLPGKHHKRDNFTRVWAHGRWLDGIWAINTIVGIAGDNNEKLIKAYNIARKAKEDADALKRQSAPEMSTCQSKAEGNGEYTGDIIPETDKQYQRRCLKFGKSTLANIVAKIINQGQGFRHDTIRDEANHLAENIHAGWLTEEECLKALHGAADENGMGSGRYGEVDDCLKSALARTSAHKPLDPLRKKKPKDDAPAAEASTPGAPTPGPAPALAPTPGIPNSGGSKKKRPEVEITTRWDLVRDEAIDALRPDDRIYLRGDSLATVWHSPKSTRKLFGGQILRNADGAPNISLLDDSRLACLLTQDADLYKQHQDREGEWISIPSNPPAWLIKAVLQHKTYPGFRSLSTVTECPYVGLDGAVVSKAGFDPATGTAVVPSFLTPAIPAKPSKKDAQDAWGRLKHLVREFPFATDFDGVVWLTALLTAISRPVIARCVPGFAFIGNQAGCGKGLLIDLIGLLVWGGPVPVSQYPTDPAEADKIALSLAIEGIQAVHFDNLEEGSRYGGGPLDSALTCEVKGGRLLGVNRWVKDAPLRPCWFLSGNNVSPKKDAFRRWIPCNLRTKLENPHERQCEVHDIKSHVSEHRPEIVRDALIILKAHQAAGYPSHGMAPLGSFEEWDHVVRAAVYFATGSDCLHTQRQATKDSPERIKRSALIQAWWNMPCQDRGFSAAEAVKMAKERVDPKDKSSDPVYAELNSALLELGYKGDLIDSNALGYLLRSIDGQIYDKFMFSKTDHKGAHNKTLWCVKDMSNV